MGGLLWNTAASGGGTAEPSYGPAPAPLDGPELPSFRYPLGSAEDQDTSTAAPPRKRMSPVSGLREARRRLHDARARRAARAALARQCRRMGLCDRGQLPRHHHRSRRTNARSSISAPATSGTSRAATAIRSRASVPAPAPSSWCSTTAISRSSAPSPSPTGSATRRPRCWPGISSCRPRPSPTFPRRKSISPPGRCRRLCPRTRRPAR